MIYAVMQLPEYRDLTAGANYPVARLAYGYLYLIGSKRRYRSSCFVFYKDGKRITRKRAELEVLMEDKK